MKAITAPRAGGPEVLTIVDVERPVPAPGEVLIRVSAAGVNRGDVLQRQGHYPPPPGASDILGLEVSGHVEELGEGTTGWRVGDSCVALLSAGGYAEYVAVPAGQVLALPPHVDVLRAGGVLEVAATVESNLGELVGPGSTVLVHGGAGGIGGFAIGYAKALGAHVVATAGSEEKLAHCRRLGADLALNYHGDWVEGLKKRYPDGADVILDIVGAKYLIHNVKALAVDGTIAVIGLQGGTLGEINLGLLVAKRGTIAARTLRSRSSEDKSAICARVAERVWPMYDDGRLQVAPTTIFGFEEVGKAHEQLTSGANVGKIVLQVAK